MPYIDVTSTEAVKRAVFHGIPYTRQEGKEIVKYNPAENNKREVIEVLEHAFVKVDKLKYNIVEDFQYVLDIIEYYNSEMPIDIELVAEICEYSNSVRDIKITATLGNASDCFWLQNEKILCLRSDIIIRNDLDEYIKNIIGEVIMITIKEK